ncbi:MAG: hypothetical protein WBL20_10325 [Sphingobium sp.]|uniref:hypothetical protein n=1 Tax=Sphingobium sp. TaxID=1912891 RepID=UPI002E24F4E3
MSKAIETLSTGDRSAMAAALDDISAFATAAQGATAETALQPGASIDQIADSTNFKRMTSAERTKLAGVAANAQANAVDSVAGKTGAVALAKSDVGLGNVDNTSDASKPVSTAVATALAGKASSAQGAKADTALQPGSGIDQLADSADFKRMTAAERTKLASVATAAQGAKADTAVQPDQLLSGAELAPVWALASQSPARAGEARQLFSSSVTGAPLARPVIASGSVVVDTGGSVLRIGSTDVPGDPGWLDIAPRLAASIHAGRVYRLRFVLRRSIDPVDPATNAIELRLQNLNHNKANVSNVRLGAAVSPVVADGIVQYEFLVGKAGAAPTLDAVIPPSTVYAVPVLRIYGNGQATDIIEVSAPEDVTHVVQTVGGLGTAAYSSATAFATAAQGAKADTAVQPGALGTAAAASATAFATAAQGNLAASALQPGAAATQIAETADRRFLTSEQRRNIDPIRSDALTLLEAAGLGELLAALVDAGGNLGAGLASDGTWMARTLRALTAMATPLLSVAQAGQVAFDRTGQIGRLQGGARIEMDETDYEAVICDDAGNVLLGVKDGRLHGFGSVTSRAAGNAVVTSFFNGVHLEMGDHNYDVAIADAAGNVLLGWLDGQFYDGLPTPPAPAAIDASPVFGDELFQHASYPVTLYVPQMTVGRGEEQAVTATLRADMGTGKAQVIVAGREELPVPAVPASVTAGTLIFRPSDAPDVRQSIALTLRGPRAAARGAVRCFAMGDSITNRGVISQVNSCLTTIGWTPSWIGTINASQLGSTPSGTAGPLGEARETRAWADFAGFDADLQMTPVFPGDEAAYLALSKTDKASRNPFLRPALGGDDPANVVIIGGTGWIFDFGYYLSRFSLLIPAVALIGLGRNDQRQAGADAPANVERAMNIILPSIRSALGATAPIILWYPPMARSAEGDAAWPVDVGIIRRKMKVLRSLRAAGDTHLHFVSTHATLPAEGSFPWTGALDPDTGILAGAISDAIHPDNIGHRQLGVQLATAIDCTLP